MTSTTELQSLRSNHTERETIQPCSNRFFPSTLPKATKNTFKSPATGPRWLLCNLLELVNKPQSSLCISSSAVGSTSVISLLNYDAEGRQKSNLLIRGCCRESAEVRLHPLSCFSDCSDTSSNTVKPSCSDALKVLVLVLPPCTPHLTYTLPLPVRLFLIWTRNWFHQLSWNKCKKFSISVCDLWHMWWWCLTSATCGLLHLHHT